ncbi:von Willebrand factor C domain-containing protein 2-like [Liparis tanakae]|uniref:von Willebrand factor C domain-containing protein 2-like n=1 Tax=Liparis tanakae TaxID=230148 RepID=A0A4Z2FKB3_9TELE|nr:von Willebrand factor C domain-containing protein 2-like [Liparis tanakae]
MVFPERLAMERSLRAAVLALLLCAQAGYGFSVAGQQDSTCEDNGSLYFVGEWYFLDSDHCTQCECTTEGSACSRTECSSLPAACIHVSHYPTDCCPRCEKIGCEYRGVVYELGQNFQPGKCCPECRDGPNCYVDASRGQVIPAGEPVWVDSCTKCRCHDGQDAGYWEGNRLATCSRLKNCTPEDPSTKKN